MGEEAAKSHRLTLRPPDFILNRKPVAVLIHVVYNVVPQFTRYINVLSAPVPHRCRTIPISIWRVRERAARRAASSSRSAIKVTYCMQTACERRSASVS